MTFTQRALKGLRLLASGTLLLGIIACGSSGDSSSTESTGSTAAESDDGLTAVPNSDGLRARVPEGVTPNGIGGAAGFYTDDDSFSMRIREDSGAMGIDEMRQMAEMIAFVRWIQNEETEDGYVLTYESHTLDDQANPTDVSVFSAKVKRNVGETSYLCEGSANSEENLAHVVEACQSVVSE